MGDLHPALRDYLLRLRSLAPGSPPSVFWERQLANFQATYARIDTLTPEELDELVAAGLTPPLDVLEIGAGAGNLAYFLTTMGLVRSYTIVDLPEMLVHSAYTLQRRIRELDIAFAEPDLHPGRYRFIPDFQAADLIDDHSVDLALNLNSFMEMDREARDGYIELVYRCTRPGGLFYNVNRRQRKLPLRDGGTWDNNPLLYPYHHDDEILVWEEDPFQTATRTKWGELASLAITRAAIVRPSERGSARPVRQALS